MFVPMFVLEWVESSMKCEQDENEHQSIVLKISLNIFKELSSKVSQRTVT